MEEQRAQPLHMPQQNAVERVQGLLQNMRHHPVWSAIVILLAITLVVSFIGGYFFNWDWTAFNGGPSKVTTTSTASGIAITTEKPISKTLWDWLQLLIVPIMIAIGGFWLNRIQRSREEKAEDQRAELARKAEDQRAELARKAEDQRAELARKAEDQRAKLEAQMDFMRRVRAVHITIEYARDLLNAHKSAKTYSEQSQRLIQLRAEVGEISEDLQASPHLFTNQQWIITGLEGIFDYLQECAKEYKHHHNEVIHDSRATTPSEDRNLCDVVKQRGMTWMGNFMEGEGNYKDKYIINLTKAKGTMRSEVYGAIQLLPVDASSSG